MDPSMILYTEDSPHFHSAKDAVNAHSASPWSAGLRFRPVSYRRWFSVPLSTTLNHPEGGEV